MYSLFPQWRCVSSGFMEKENICDTQQLGFVEMENLVFVDYKSPFIDGKYRVSEVVRRQEGLSPKSLKF